jgi:hypothetical protein
MLEVIKRLQRVVMIIKLLVDQVMITETMVVMIFKLLVLQVMITKISVDQYSWVAGDTLPDQQAPFHQEMILKTIPIGNWS